MAPEPAPEARFFTLERLRGHLGDQLVWRSRACPPTTTKTIVPLFDLPVCVQGQPERTGTIAIGGAARERKAMAHRPVDASSTPLPLAGRTSPMLVVAVCAEAASNEARAMRSINRARRSYTSAAADLRHGPTVSSSPGAGRLLFDDRFGSRGDLKRLRFGWPVLCTKRTFRPPNPIQHRISLGYRPATSQPVAGTR